MGKPLPCSIFPGHHVIDHVSSSSCMCMPTHTPPCHPSAILECLMFCLEQSPSSKPLPEGSESSDQAEIFCSCYPLPLLARNLLTRPAGPQVTSFSAELHISVYKHIYISTPSEIQHCKVITIPSHGNKKQAQEAHNPIPLTTNSPTDGCFLTRAHS